MDGRNTTRDGLCACGGAHGLGTSDIGATSTRAHQSLVGGGARRVCERSAVRSWIRRCAGDGLAWGAVAWLMVIFVAASGLAGEFLLVCCV